MTLDEQPRGTSENAYPLPLYLNQKYVFDVLAMMERGFTQLESVTSRSEAEQQRQAGLSGGVGFQNVFGLLNVTLGAGRGRQERGTETQEVTTDRVHTPNSLFARMRERLWEEDLVRGFDEAELSSGAFVEATMRLEKNPLVESLETLHSILRMGAIFEEPTKPTGGQKRRAPRAQSESERLLEQMSDLVNQLNTGVVVDLLATPVETGSPRVVLTLDTSYASDPSLSDLIDGEYRVLGKVTRFLEDGSDETINLLRKTTLGRIQGELLEGLKQPFAEMSKGGIALPEFDTEIAPPVVQMLPISVFA